MTIKGFKFAPVAWMTTALTGLGALEAVNAKVHVLPAGWTPYLVLAIAVLTAVLGVLTHGAVTPTVAPRDDAGVPLVPAYSKTPPSTRGSGTGGAGMSSW